MSHPTSSSHESHGAGHVLPPKVLLSTGAALLALTILTVAVSRVDLGAANGAVAIAIAATKAAVVALFFMHLKYENKFLGVILVTCVLAAVFFVVFVIFDTTQYQADLQAHEAAAAQKAAVKAGAAAPGEHDHEHEAEHH